MVACNTDSKIVDVAYAIIVEPFAFFKYVLKKETARVKTKTFLFFPVVHLVQECGSFVVLKHIKPPVWCVKRAGRINGVWCF